MKLVQEQQKEHEEERKDAEDKAALESIVERREESDPDDGSWWDYFLSDDWTPWSAGFVQEGKRASFSGINISAVLEPPQFWGQGDSHKQCWLQTRSARAESGSEGFGASISGGVDWGSSKEDMSSKDV